MDYTKEYKKYADLFSLDGDVLSIEPYGNGHINVTLLVTTDEKRYIMQIMNTVVFKNSDNLMSNICAVTEFLRNKGIETLEVIPTKDGKSYYKGEKSVRVYKFIENTVTYQTPKDVKVFKNTGKAFGEFQNQLEDFDASVLYETIPDFHNTPDRFQKFKTALLADCVNRKKDCEKEIEFILARGDTYSEIVDGLNERTIPLRVTHNDTKLNNILMDAESDEARAIIDLDTVMPGSMLYDFGDSIRFGASTASEDEKDITKVDFDIKLFEAYASGFIPAVKNSITAEEVKLLPYSAYLMTIECGMRFLTDYLSGDIYFKTAYPEHNLVRARTQLKLADKIQAAFDKALDICLKCAK